MVAVQGATKSDDRMLVYVVRIIPPFLCHVDLDLVVEQTLYSSKFPSETGVSEFLFFVLMVENIYS